MAGTVAKARQLRGSSRATCGVACKQQREMNKWIANDKAHTEEKGVSGVLGALEGAERWTRTMDKCLSIDDMEGLGSAEEDTEANERETERR